MFLIAILLLGFPRELPGSAEMRARAIKEGQLPKEDQKIKGKWKDIIPATTLLIKNPTFLFNSLAITAHSLYGAAVSAFLAKFAQVKFAVNPAVNGISLGAVFLVAASGKRCLLCCLLDYLFHYLFIFVYLFINDDSRIYPGKNGPTIRVKRLWDTCQIWAKR